MKLKYLLITAAASALLAGCDRENQSTPTATDKSVSAQDVKQDAGRAMNSAKDYAGQTKDQFVATMDKKMKQLDAEIDELGKKSENYKDDAKVEADKALASLHEQREVLKKKYEELKDASQDAWEKTKAGCESAWDDVEKTYENAKAKFN